MKKLILLALVSCGQQEIQQLPQYHAPHSPQTVPEQPTQTGEYDYYMDALKTTAVHEFGHALSLIHPFDSVNSGHDCRALLKSISDIEFPIRDYMIGKDTQYWDYSEDFMYDEYSIMQYDVCRKGYRYNPYPTAQDIVEVNALFDVFVGKMNLVMPIVKETFQTFRVSPDVPVCFAQEQPSDVVEAVQHAIDVWSETKYNITFEGVCDDEHYNNDHAVRIDSFKMTGSKAGNSRVGRSNERVTMNIGIPNKSDYVIDDFSRLIND